MAILYCMTSYSYHHLIELFGHRVCIVDINVAGIHHRYNVSAGRRNDKVTDAVVKATNIKQLYKAADVNESYDAILT